VISPNLRSPDGAVVLRPLDLDDIDAHLAGEDEELVRWLNGGPGTRDGVERHVRACMAAWRAGGPVLTFGIRAPVPVDGRAARDAPDLLVGTIDAHVAPSWLEPGQANLAYGIYPQARGSGLATRAVLLVCTYLAAEHGVREAVIRTEPANGPSGEVARRAGFTRTGRGPDGLDHFQRVLSPAARDREPMN